MSVAINMSRTAVDAPARSGGAARDLRLDFFRGLALLMIFIDHVAGNSFAMVTLHSFGFADAAEIFVFVAGMAGVYAYRRLFLAQGFEAGARAVFARIRKLYLAHMLMVGGTLLAAMALMLIGTGFDVIGKLGLQPLLDDPAAAMTRLPLLAYLPHYLDILPLYVVLLAALPLIILGMRRHVLLPVGLAGVSYIAAQVFDLALPNLGHPAGWFLNPFAWVLLFAIGAAAAELSIRGAWASLPRAALLVLTALAGAYAVFAALHAAPWRVLPGFEAKAAFDWALAADKTTLSWHRLFDILAKAWLVALLVPRGAAFMTEGLAGAVSRAGRHSLPVFATGTFLAVLGSVILYEGGGTAFWQVAVTFGGIALLLGLGRALEARRPAAKGLAVARAA